MPNPENNTETETIENIDNPPYSHKHIPPELKEALYALQHEIVWEVYIYILNNKKVPISDIFGIIPHNKIPDPIKLLLQGGLIIRKTSNLNDRNKDYYTPTKIGKQLIEALINVYLPDIPHNSNIKSKEKQNL